MGNTGTPESEAAVEAVYDRFGQYFFWVYKTAKIKSVQTGSGCPGHESFRKYLSIFRVLLERNGSRLAVFNRDGRKWITEHWKSLRRRFSLFDEEMDRRTAANEDILFEMDDASPPPSASSDAAAATITATTTANNGDYSTVTTKKRSPQRIQQDRNSYQNEIPTLLSSSVAILEPTTTKTGASAIPLAPAATFGGYVPVAQLPLSALSSSLPHHSSGLLAVPTNMPDANAHAHVGTGGRMRSFSTGEKRKR